MIDDVTNRRGSLERNSAAGVAELAEVRYAERGRYTYICITTKLLYMRPLFFLVFFLHSYFVVSGQTLTLDKVYENRAELLLNTAIIEVDSTSVEELMQRFENWAGRNFRNYNEVQTSKTSDQITLNYVTSAFGPIDFYIRLVAEFKDSRARMRFYDDGNVQTSGARVGRNYVPGQASRAFYIHDYFRRDGEVKGMGGYERNVKSYKRGLFQSISDIENTLKNVNSTLPSDDDW